MLNELSANGWRPARRTLRIVIRGANLSHDGRRKNIVILGRTLIRAGGPTRDTAHPDQPVPGATRRQRRSVLLELSRVLHIEKPDQRYGGVLRCGRQWRPDGWNWIVGLPTLPSTHHHAHGVGGDRFDGQQQGIYWSAIQFIVAGAIWDTAAGLGYGAQFIKQPSGIWWGPYALPMRGGKQ